MATRANSKPKGSDPGIKGMSPAEERVFAVALCGPHVAMLVVIVAAVVHHIAA